MFLNRLKRRKNGKGQTYGTVVKLSSELHIADAWYCRTALEDLLSIRVDQANDDRSYVGLGQLLPHKETIEKHLEERLGDLSDLESETRPFTR